MSWSRGVSLEELRRELTGDMDGILLKALEKDPLRRYSSVAEFSEDVRRYLKGESVRARRHVELYAGWKFLQLHFWMILGAATVALAWANGLIVIRAIPARIQMFFFILLILVMIGSIGTWRRYRDSGTGIRRILAPYLKLGAVFLLGIAALPLLPPQPRTQVLGGFGCILAVAGLWFSLIEWPLRANLLGPLLLTGIRRPPWFWGIWQLSAGVGLLWPAIRGWRDTPSWYRIDAVWAISVIAFSLYMLLSRRVEIRQKGLASSGMLYPWSKIASYEWDPNPGEFEVLRLRTNGLTSWFPARLLVRKEFRSAFDDALARQFMQWPVRSN